MATLNQIIDWWDNNIVPTVAQRVATFSSFWHKSDTIAISDIDGLEDALNTKLDASSLVTTKVILAAGTETYDVPENTLLLNVWFIAGETAAAIGVGYDDATNDVFEIGELPADGNLVFSGVVPFKNARRIYFNGIASDTVVVIIKM